MSNNPSENPRVADILKLEERLGQALVAGDFDYLRGFFTEDMTFGHASGRIDDREQFLGNLQNRIEYKSLTRKDLAVRFYAGGEVAIITGPLDLTIQPRNGNPPVSVAMNATQVWIKRGQGWQQVAFHGAHAPAPGAHR